MKQLLPILCVLIIVSCSKEIKEITADRTVQIDGLTYEVNSQTPFTGTRLMYFENGKLRMRQNLLNGMEHGLLEHFHLENGQLKDKIMFVDGEEEGTFEQYDRNGQLQSVDCFKVGKKVNMSNCDNES